MNYTDNKICKNCRHFRQHYILDNQSCSRVHCGHCTYPRLKSRTPDTSACAHFLRRDNTEEAPAAIHYLTEELLRHLLSLPLPPDDHTGK